jgi:catechol 2,3-dioxygenase-like lactoylglutathione lyase family enzyme
VNVGPIEAVRVFTTKLDVARKFYEHKLGLGQLADCEGVAIFDTGQAKLILEHVDANDPEASELVGRFAGFSFTVTDMAAARGDLRSVEWVAPPERQAWGGVLAHFKDPDGNVLTLVQYP